MRKASSANRTNGAVAWRPGNGFGGDKLRSLLSRAR